MSLSKSTYGSGLKTYKDNEVTTMSQSKLIVMLYDGAIRFLKIAEENIDNYKKYDYVNENLKKAHDILNELLSSLNMEEGGEIAKNLFNLYVYMKQRILDANVKKDKSIVKEVIKLLSELKASWEEVSKKDSSSTVMPSASKGAGISIKG